MVQKTKTENVMRKIRIEKVTLNIGVKQHQDADKAYLLLERITGRKPVRTLATRRARTFKVRRGLPIGAKITLRGEIAEEVLKKLLEAKDNKLNKKNFDDHGNFGFGIEEYLDIPGIKYDPKIGVLGLDVFVNLERPGYRVKRRKYHKSKIGKNHLITKEEAMEFIREKFNVEII